MTEEEAGTEPVQGIGSEPGASLTLVADFTGTTLKPTVSLDWERLSRGELSVDVILQDPVGQETRIPIPLDEVVRERLSSIERYYADGALTLHKEFESPFLGEAGGRNSSSTKRINELLRWQQFIDMAAALEPEDGPDSRWGRLRSALLDRVDLLYRKNFGLLREQLRNDKTGAATVSRLFASRNEAQVDIALRLVALEPSLAAAVQEELAEISTDRTLGSSIRLRALNRLTSAAREPDEE
ncbi:hypothetical protein ACFVGM_05515 [Kitasatospora purpeofusca]|uniref:hypothetical protein n=1 Tax=Kitasatospora purpeofusca TaxID=67352 RepID=UPI0036C0244A